MRNFNKRIYDVGFVLYPLDDSLPMYFDDINEFLIYYGKTYDFIRRLVYRFNRAKEDYIYIKDIKEKKIFKLYYID